MKARFPIGTQYTRPGKRGDVCTVVDILKTYNSAGDLVKVRYVAETLFLGQKLQQVDVVDPTIARNLIGNLEDFL